MTESEEELKSLLMKLKEESEKVGLNSTFRKLRSWHLVPSLHGKPITSPVDLSNPGIEPSNSIPADLLQRIIVSLVNLKYLRE